MPTTPWASSMTSAAAWRSGAVTGRTVVIAPAEGLLRPEAVATVTRGCARLVGCRCPGPLLVRRACASTAAPTPGRPPRSATLPRRSVRRWPAAASRSCTAAVTSGLMGVVADAALAAGGEVIGVITDQLVSAEVAHRGLSSLEVVPDMHQRKARFEQLSDGFIALPGGFGTVEEVFELLTWNQLGLVRKPVVLLDVERYWSSLFDWMDQAVDAGLRAPVAPDAGPARPHHRRGARAGAGTGTRDPEQVDRPRHRPGADHAGAGDPSLTHRCIAAPARTLVATRPSRRISRRRRCGRRRGRRCRRATSSSSRRRRHRRRAVPTVPVDGVVAVVAGAVAPTPGDSVWPEAVVASGAMGDGSSGAPPAGTEGAAAGVAVGSDTVVGAIEPGASVASWCDRADGGRGIGRLAASRWCRRRRSCWSPRPAPGCARRRRCRAPVRSRSRPPSSPRARPRSTGGSRSGSSHLHTLGSRCPPTVPRTSKKRPRLGREMAATSDVAAATGRMQP